MGKGSERKIGRAESKKNNWKESEEECVCTKYRWKV